MVNKCVNSLTLRRSRGAQARIIIFRIPHSPTDLDSSVVTRYSLFLQFITSGVPSDKQRGAGVWVSPPHRRRLQRGGRRPRGGHRWPLPRRRADHQTNKPTNPNQSPAILKKNYFLGGHTPAQTKNPSGKTILATKKKVSPLFRRKGTENKGGGKVPAKRYMPNNPSGGEQFSDRIMY